MNTKNQATERQKEEKKKREREKTKNNNNQNKENKTKVLRFVDDIKVVFLFVLYFYFESPCALGRFQLELHARREDKMDVDIIQQATGDISKQRNTELDLCVEDKWTVDNLVL